MGVEATEKFVTKVAVSDPILAGPLAGFFSTSDSKTVSIIEGQPFPDFVMVSFTDENDDMGINAQTFHVPKELFDAAIDAYRRPAAPSRAAAPKHKPKA